MGGILIISFLLQVVLSDPLSWRFWFNAVSLIFAATFFISLNFGTLINRLTVQDEFLVVRWYSKIFKKRISIADISEITGDDDYIRIMLKTGKHVKLPVSMLEPHEIRSVYKFLNEAVATTAE
jgi:hypothetical protein